MKRFLIVAAIFAASLGYGCVAHAQCPGGQCPTPQYATPVRTVVHQTAQVLTQVTAPRCQGASEHKGLFERIAERREQRKVQRGGGCCR